MLNKKFEVKLFYEYCLTVENLYKAERTNLICVQLYNWNGGRAISSDAKKYAKECNMKLFTFRGFCIFAHNNIK